jgi:serine/threonine protein kinase
MVKDPGDENAIAKTPYSVIHPPPAMSYCLNPLCTTPQNPTHANFCQRCGQPLRLNQRYRSVKLLGQGGFGRTFLARDEHTPTATFCVIKQFHPLGQPHSPKAAQLFQQEAMRLAELGHHDQIPTLYAHFEEQGQQYIVQQYIEGQNLAEEFQQAGVFSETQVRELLLDLLPVLQFVHQGGVIHRDIKPENIIRRRSDRRLILVDFGAAKYATVTALAQTGTMIGSAEYTAPEQLKGRATLSSDLYSLGVTCLALLTGLSPFDLFDVHEDRWNWRAYLDQNPVSDGLGTVLDRMVANAVKDRWASSEEIFAALTKMAATPGSPTGDVFQPLIDLLQTEQWHAADVETGRLLLQWAGRDRNGWLRLKDIARLASEDLASLDQLWVDHSHGLFGFSVQRRIYERLGENNLYRRYKTVRWQKFGDIVGWRGGDRWLPYTKLDFHSHAPQGHLPRYCFNITGRRAQVWFYGWPHALWKNVTTLFNTLPPFP